MPKPLKRYIPSPAAEQQRVDNWNARHPVGTPVTRFEFSNPPRGAEQETKTRSAAWLMGGHTAVVSVEGHAGGGALDAVQVKQSQ